MSRDKQAVITLGGGCFWCVEAVFQEIDGVRDIVSGYTGGTVKHPTYREVCMGTTGHAEVVQITFDPAIVSLESLLKVFFLSHNPTTLNRQGADVGTQYRSVIFYRDEKQRKIAENVKNNFAAEAWGSPLVTEIRPLVEFYEAEEQHQNYFRNNPQQAYCQMIIEPKIQKIRKHFRDKLKATA